MSVSPLLQTNKKIFVFTSICFAYTFYIDILDNKTDLELPPSGLACLNFVKLNHATFIDKLALGLWI